MYSIFIRVNLEILEGGTGDRLKEPTQIKVFATNGSVRMIRLCFPPLATFPFQGGPESI
jgi:hypothetical protein